jgi:lipopolysaccharide export system permease protein
MLPVANLKYFSLLYDARKQKSADLLPAMVFSNSFPGYTIRVKSKDPDGQRLYGIMIYKKTADGNNTTVTIAREGTMFRTMGDKFLVLKLKDGVSYEESPGENAAYNYRQHLTRFRFKETEQKFDLSSFKMARTDENEFKQASQMMNLKQLKFFIDSVQRVVDVSIVTNYKLITPYIKYFSIPAKSTTVKKFIPADKTGVLKSMTLADQSMAISSAASEVRSIKDVVKNRTERYKSDSMTIRRYASEVQKKFTLSAACIALFLIGAPLGAIIRKGGLGLPVVISVIFFLIYYIISTIGEKSVRAGNVSTFFGMWIAIIVLTPIGLFLSYKAATDSAIFDVELYKRAFNKLIRRKGN